MTTTSSPRLTIAATDQSRVEPAAHQRTDFAHAGDKRDVDPDLAEQADQRCAQRAAHDRPDHADERAFQEEET